MTCKKFIFVFLAILLLGTGLVIAYPSNASAVSELKLDRWVAVSGAAASVATEGGNISEVNVTAAEQLTDRWAGFYGNVTPSSIRLRASGDVNDLYNWTGTLIGGGEVCVSPGAYFDFSAIREATEEDVSIFWFFGAVADNVTETYTGYNCSLVFTDINSTQTDNADYIDHAGYSSFRTCAFHDTTSGPESQADLAFCTAINTSGTNYNGLNYHYELMVPTNIGSAQTYYFFVEIN